MTTLPKSNYYFILIYIYFLIKIFIINIDIINILINNKNLNRSFVLHEGLKKIQEIKAAPGTKLREYIDKINNLYP